MDDDVDPLGRQTEEEVRLDDLEALVHHRGRIDRDLRPHLPRGMREGVLDRDGVERLETALPEWPARGRQHEATRLLGPAGAHRLVDRAVLGVDGDQLGPALLRFVEDQLAGHDERFLVGEREALAGAHGGVRRPQAERPDEPAHHRVGLRIAGGLHQTVGPRHDPAFPARGQEALEARDILGPVDGHELRREGGHLLGELLDRAASRERGDPEPVGEGRHDVECGSADRARRSEDGEGFHRDFFGQGAHGAPRTPTFYKPVPTNAARTGAANRSESIRS